MAFRREPLHGLGETVACAPDAVPIVVLTTNGERDLPPAFLRRCVELRIKAPENSPAGRAKLFTIAHKHGLDLDNETREWLADAFFEAPRRERREANAAEFLDLVRAWQHLKLAADRDKATLNAVLHAIMDGASAGGL